MTLRSGHVAVLVAALILTSDPAPARAQTVVTPRLVLAAPGIRDQDDMCFWIHPTDPALSTIITADKDDYQLYVYDLQGALVQSVAIPGLPANIDIRYDFLLDGVPVDLISINNREGRLDVFRVDPATRELHRVDNGAILTGDNYGSCMYRSALTGTYYAFTASETGQIEQYALRDEGGQVAGTLVRSWDIGGRTEGCVCDDETGMAYFGEERVGIWKVGAEPGDPVAGTLIARIGDSSGMTGEVEGLTIYYASGGGGYLIASDQGRSEYIVLDRREPHEFIKTFAIENTSETDGVDVTNVNLGPAFPAGMFAAHSNIQSAPKPVKVCAYEDLGLAIDTEYWNPRGAGSSPVILSFAPAGGLPGTEVTVAGMRFTGVTNVMWGNVEAEFSIDSDTQLRATVPVGASTGPIRVSGPHGTGVSAVSFIVPLAPTIAGFAPASGMVGSEVAITGTEFLAVTAVEFNGTASTFVIDSDTQLRATVPAAATTGPIRVSNPTGSAVSATDFTVTVPPSELTFTPVHDTRVISTSPTTGYGAVTLLRVRSVSPTYRTYLKFGVTGVSGAVERATLRLFCDDASVDGGEVYAVANDYLGTTTPWVESGLTWNNAPAITGSPLDEEGAVGLGTWVEFDVTAAVTGNGNYSFGMTSGSTNIAGYSSKEGVNPPQLVLAFGTASPPLLAITGFAPTSGPVGTEVTVTGTEFLAVTAVEFNGIAATFVIDSNTQLRATVSASTTSGPIRVINQAGSALSPVDFVVLEPQLAITGFTPAGGPVGSEVAVTGTEFLTVTTVEFNGIAATFVIDSNTQLRATVPAAATTGPIRVSNPSGSAVSATDFTLTAPPSDLTLTPVHDTRVLSTSPSTGYGAVTLLRVRSVSPTYRTYLKFGVTGVSGAVERATLRLFCDDASVDGGEVYAVANDYLGTTTPWVESGLTWNNAPAITGSPLDEEGAVGLGTWVEFDVTAAVTGNGNYSFGMTSGSTNIAGYSSKEGVNPPQLVLAFGTASPPLLAITGFAPTSGPVGTEVTVTGTEFLAVTAVEFNGIAATFVIDSNTQLRATVPASATTGPIRVSNPTASAVSATDFAVTAPPSDLTFTPVHDTRVLSTSPNTAYGAVTLLRVRSVSPTYRTYLKFEVAGVSGAVERATLRLYCDDASVDGGEVYAVANDYLGTTTAWVESGLTWNNAPGISGSPLDEEGAVVLGTWVEFDVTAAVTGNGSYSFGMTSGSTNIAGYSSKEGANPPQLVIRTGSLLATVSAASSSRPSGGVPAGSILLGRPRPNPFSQQTSIRLDLSSALTVRATVYDIAGREVRSLGHRDLAPGSHDLVWDGRDSGGNPARSGIYLLRLEAPGMTTTTRLVLSR